MKAKRNLSEGGASVIEVLAVLVVAAVLLAFAAAQFGDRTLLRGIAADGKPAALVLVRTDDWTVEALLVDRMLQRRGIGRATLEQLAALASTAGADTVRAARLDGAGNPTPFLLACGFEENEDVLLRRTAG